MNEIVPESPEKDSDFDDENSYVPETPQKDGSPEINMAIPIPSFNRIRKSLGILNSNADVLSFTPTGKKSHENSIFGYQVRLSKFKNDKKNRVSSHHKVKVSLFRDLINESKPKEKTFSVNTRSFYGSSNNKKESYQTTKPILTDKSKSSKKQNPPKKLSPNFHNSVSKRSRKHKSGEINFGVGHGIKRPKRKRNSLKNESIQEEIFTKKYRTEDNLNKNPQDIVRSKNSSISPATKRFFKSNQGNRQIPIHSKSTKQDKVIKTTIEIQRCQCSTKVSNNGNTEDKTNIPFKSLSYNDRTVDAFDKKKEIVNLSNEEFIVEGTHMENQCDLDNLMKILQEYFIDNPDIEKPLESDLDIFFHNTNPSLESASTIVQENSENLNVVQEAMKQTQEWETDLVKKCHVSTEWQCQSHRIQKDFCLTECKECSFSYCIDDPGDEKVHENYHSSFQLLQFQDWENERIVFQDPLSDSHIILIEPNDSSQHQEKIGGILEIVCRDLDYCDSELSNLKNMKIYFYIRKKSILGVLVTEIVHNAYRMIPELVSLVNCCESESSCVKCGIKVVWTLQSHQRQGIATKLVDILRETYLCNSKLSIDDIAFSVPTSSGKSFAEKYCKTQNFKVY